MHHRLLDIRQVNCTHDVPSIVHSGNAVRAGMKSFVSAAEVNSLISLNICMVDHHGPVPYMT